MSFVRDWVIVANYSLPLLMGLNIPILCLVSVVFPAGRPDLGFALTNGM